MKKYLLLLGLILLLSSCQNNEKTEEIYSENETNIMPETMPEDFDIIFEYGFEQASQHDGINTIDNTISKDLITDGLVISEFEISAEDLEDIYNLLRENNVIKYPSIFEPPYKDDPEPGVERNCTPSMEYKLNIYYEGYEYNLYWHNANCSEAKNAMILQECFNELIQIIRSTEAYRAFPESSGGYD